MFSVLAGNSSGPSYNPYGSPLSTNGHLWCYECKESYANNLRSHGSGTGSSGYDPLNSPCSNNLSAITIRQCGPEAVYCKVKRFPYHWSFVRGILLTKWSVMRKKWVMRSVGVSFVINKLLDKQSSRPGCERPWRSCDVTVMFSVFSWKKMAGFLIQISLSLFGLWGRGGGWQ